MVTFFKKLLIPFAYIYSDYREIKQLLFINKVKRGDKVTAILEDNSKVKAAFIAFSTSFPYYPIIFRFDNNKIDLAIDIIPRN